MAKLSVTSVDRLVGKRIQQKRKEVGLSASELSEKIGIAQQQLSRYERGENKINITHLVDIAIYLETSISWFFMDCISENTMFNRRKYVPITDNEIESKLYSYIDQLNIDKKRALLVFLENIID
ncbi:helix-turn-helix domain-containing protein [Avibacterium avium]|uniref:helix-turn-helix domain-containing protein n=1 Tax=Avibacterium avium TaxID=751 RepID=UPI003BF85D06